MSLVFQYGSNTSAKRLNAPGRLDGAAKIVGTAYTVDKFDLDFTVWSKTNKCAAADIVSNGSVQIWGTVYDIPDARICRHLSGNQKSLDEIEGEGENYERIKISIMSNESANEIISAWTYIVRERKNGLKTSAAYATKILNGLKSNNIPTFYQEYVRSRILLNNEELKGELPSPD